MNPQGLTDVMCNFGWGVSVCGNHLLVLSLVKSYLPSKWVGLGSPLAACSVYGDLTCSVHTVNNLCMFNCQCNFYLCNRGPYVRLAFVPNMLSSWNKDIIIIIIMSGFSLFTRYVLLIFSLYCSDMTEWCWKLSLLTAGAVEITFVFYDGNML